MNQGTRTASRDSLERTRVRTPVPSAVLLWTDSEGPAIVRKKLKSIRKFEMIKQALAAPAS